MAQVILDPVANGLATAWAGNGYLDVDDGAVANDADFVSSGTTLDTRESYRLANVTSGQIPDGSTINFVRVLVRAQRGGATNAAFVAEIGYGGGPTWSPSGTLTTVSGFGEFTADWTTDPSNGSAWTVATLRAWSTTRDFAVRNTQTRSVQVSRLRVLVDYTAPTSVAVTGFAVAGSQGTLAARVADGVTVTGLSMVSSQGVAARLTAPAITGRAISVAMGDPTTTGALVIPPVGYAGRWPNPLESNYESLDPYVLAPMGAATLETVIEIGCVAPATGTAAALAQGVAAVTIPGGTRTVNVSGIALTSTLGTLVREMVFGGSVMVRSRFKQPRGVARWRQRSRLSVTTPTFLLSSPNRTVTLAGQALGSSQGVAGVPRSGTTSPLVQVVSRRLRDRVRSYARRNSTLTVVTRQLALSGTRPVGATLTAAQGTVTVTGVARSITLVGISSALSLGGTATSGALVVPPVGYAGRWPDWFDGGYESLDPYFLTPVVAATTTIDTPIVLPVPVSGLAVTATQGVTTAVMPGGTRTVAVTGATLSSRSGSVFRDVIAGGAVLVRSRFKAARGYARWRKRSRLTMVAPAVISSARVVTLTGQQLSAAQRSVTVTVPRNGFVGQTTQLVSTRTRKRWQDLGRSASRLTVVTSTSMNTRFKVPVGQSITVGQGTVTTTGVPTRVVNLAGTSVTLGQGSVLARTTDATTLAGITLQLQLGTVTPRKMSIQGSVITLGQGQVTMGSVSRSVTLGGLGVTVAQGAVQRTLEFLGDGELVALPTVRKFAVVTFDGQALVTFEHQVLRGGALVIESNATLSVAPVQRYSGVVTTGGNASCVIDLTVPPSTVSAMYQQFEAEQQLGYKI